MKKVGTLLALLIIISFLTSCNSNDILDFYSNASLVKVHSVEASTLSFSLTLFSKEKINNVDYISVEGLGFEPGDLSVEITDNTIDEVSLYKYKGLQAKCILVEIKPVTSLGKVTISALVIKVDNNIQKVSFPNYIQHEFADGIIYSEDLEIRVIPCDFASSVLGDAEDSTYVYQFAAQKDLRIEKVYCLDYFDIEVVGIRIDDTSIENVSLPYDVKKGQDVAIRIHFKPKNLTTADYVETNLYFTYKTNQEDDLKENSFIIVFDPVYPILNNDSSNINNIVDRLVP